MPFLIRMRTLKTDTPNFFGIFALDKDVDGDTGPAVGQGNALIPTLPQWADYIDSVVSSFEKHPSSHE